MTQVKSYQRQMNFVISPAQSKTEVAFCMFNWVFAWIGISNQTPDIIFTQPDVYGAYCAVFVTGARQLMIRPYNDVIMTVMASQIPASRLFTQPFIQGADRRKHQSSAPGAFVRGIRRWPVNSPHKWPVTRKMFPFDDIIMRIICVLRFFLLSAGCCVPFNWEIILCFFSSISITIIVMS